MFEPYKPISDIGCDFKTVPSYMNGLVQFSKSDPCGVVIRSFKNSLKNVLCYISPIPHWEILDPVKINSKSYTNIHSDIAAFVDRAIYS